MERGDLRRFRRDPLVFIENLRRRSQKGVFRLPWGGWCVADARLARVVLRGPDFNEGAAPLFGELLPSRSAQVEFALAVAETVRAHIPYYRAKLAAAVAEWPTSTRWPAAGPELVYRCAADLLLHPDAPLRLRRLLEQATRGGIMIRPPHAWQRARAELLRGRLLAAVTEHVRSRRADRADVSAPRDVLDTMIGACPAEITDRAVAELYLLLFRSIVGVAGHSVAWSTLLACLHAPGSPWPWPADWVAREAARRRAVVWMVGRSAPHDVELGGTSIPAGEAVWVCPHLLHHDERRWPDPAVFRPARWAEPGQLGPYLPFGAGPFVGSGTPIARTLVTEAVAALSSGARLTVTSSDTRPIVTSAAIPRPFMLHRVPTREGGDRP